MSECARSSAAGWAPDWIFCPREKILSVVVEWIVSGFRALGNTIADAISEVWGAVGLAGRTARDGLVWSFGNVAGSFSGLFDIVNAALLELASSAGPLSPFVIVGLYASLGAVLVASLVALRKGILWLT